MRDYLAHEVRNVTVLGHSGAGKTAVLEAMLHFTKATDRFGKTSEGSSIIDYDPEEVRRGLSVYTSIVPIEWKDTKINFIDTPGYLDFVGEMESGCAAGDNILIVVGAKEGVQSGTQRAWEVAMEKKLLRMLYDCFYIRPEFVEQEEEVRECHKALIEVLAKPERKLVLRIIDA